MKKVCMGMFVLLCVMFIGGCNASGYAKVEDIELTPAYWTTEGEFLGIDYTDAEGGVLLRNTSSEHAEVKVKATYYDKDQNYIDDNSKSITLKANESWFIFFDIDDKASDIKYSVETKDVFWEPAKASEVEFGYEEGKIIVKNKSEKDIGACDFQYVFYDKDGVILYVDGGSVNNGYVPAGEKVAEEYSLEYPSYLKDYEDFEINLYCLYDK